MSDADRTYLQENQPEGVPPLELTGERTLPDVPEENYWYRRHVAVYEWIADRCAGLRVADLACGEGYGSDLLAERAAEVIGVDANPEAYEHAAGALPAPQPELPARTGRGVRPAGGRRRLPADDRAHPRAGSTAGPDRRDRPGRLHLDPEPAHARAARARRSPTTPGTCASTTRPSTESCSSPISSAWSILGLFHARKLRAHELAIRLGWDRVHPALRLTKPFYERLHSRDQRRRLQPAGRRPRSRPRLRRRSAAS